MRICNIKHESMLVKYCTQELQAENLKKRENTIILLLPLSIASTSQSIASLIINGLMKN